MVEDLYLKKRVEENLVKGSNSLTRLWMPPSRRSRERPEKKKKKLRSKEAKPLWKTTSYKRNSSLFPMLSSLRTRIREKRETVAGEDDEQ